MKNINTNMLYVISSIIQVTIAAAVSQAQSRQIKQNASQTKYIQLGFAFFVFMMGVVQTMTIVNKIITTCRK